MTTNELKRVASWTNWNGCIEVATEILTMMSIRDIKKLAYSYIEEYLPIFERYQEEVKWPRERLLVIAKALDAKLEYELDSFILPESNSEFTSPGSNGFIKDLEDLWELTSHQETRDTVNEAMGVISGVIMRKLTERWASEQPEEWERWYRKVTNQNQDGGQLHHLDFVEHPSVHQMARVEWIILANRLEAYIVASSNK